MNNSSICEECTVILTHYLCTIYKKILVYSIFLDKRGYNDLNCHLCVSYARKNKTNYIVKELDTNKPVLKYLKLDICKYIYLRKG